MKRLKNKKVKAFQNQCWLDRLDFLELIQEMTILGWQNKMPRNKFLASALLSLLSKDEDTFTKTNCNFSKLEAKPESIKLDCLQDFLSDNIDIPLKYRYLYYLFTVYSSKELSDLVNTDLGDISRKKQELLHLLKQSWGQ